MQGFCPYIVQAILKIPLLPDDQPNNLIWAQDYYCIFNVESAYRLFIDTLDHQFNVGSIVNN